MHHKSLVRIIIFYLISIVLSNIFRFDLLDLRNQTSANSDWISIVTMFVLEGIGILIGGIIGIHLLRKHKKLHVTVFGTDLYKSLLFILIPVIVLAILGIRNEFEINISYYGFIVGAGTLVYCFFEELGWRGYLQNELSDLKSWQRYVIIGFLWYLWHLAFITDFSIEGNLFFLGMMIAGSWGIGQVANATKSVLACTGFHFIINVVMYNQLIQDGLNSKAKLLFIGICVLSFMVILRFWRKVKISKETQVY